MQDSWVGTSRPLRTIRLIRCVEGQGDLVADGEGVQVPQQMPLHHLGVGGEPVFWRRSHHLLGLADVQPQPGTSCRRGST